ncbi:MAG: ABC transporter ATP-binding protein [Planctomycetota bacterium]
MENLTNTTCSQAIVAEGIEVTFRGPGRTALQALRAVDLRVNPGEVVGILGPNGSGKTTLLRVLAGTLRPRRGRVEILGRAATDRALARAVGYQPEEPLPFPHLSARELLHFVGSLAELPRKLARARAAAVLERLGLADVAERRHGHYSKGMARRLALAAAMLTDPSVLLLDEPTAGLDPLGSAAVQDAITEMAARGAAVLLSSHNLQEVEQTCARAVVLHGGRVRAAGTLDELLGTGAQALVVDGLDRPGLARVTQAIDTAGGTLLRVERERAHLFALFRELEQAPPLEPSPTDGRRAEGR